jgi:ribonuclease T1
MNKKRIISIIVAVILAAIFGTEQFDRGNPEVRKTNSSARTGQVGAGEIAFDALPREGQVVIRQIFAGGPFKYRKDGTVFQNREGRLPDKKRGYYREYTVKTPGEKTRGARRIVAGGPKSQPDVMYYTKDHYRSFLKVRGARQ